MVCKGLYALWLHEGLRYEKGLYYARVLNEGIRYVRACVLFSKYKDKKLFGSSRCPARMQVSCSPCLRETSRRAEAHCIANKFMLYATRMQPYCACYMPYCACCIVKVRLLALFAFAYRTMSRDQACYRRHSPLLSANQYDRWPDLRQVLGVRRSSIEHILARVSALSFVL
jgi:hypothetical protein